MVKVIFSEGESTVHVKLGSSITQDDGTVFEAHESKLLLPGEMISLDEATDYLVELVKQGKAPGLVLIDESKAKALIEQANLVKGIANVDDNESSDVTTLEESILSDF